MRSSLVLIAALAASVMAQEQPPTSTTTTRGAGTPRPNGPNGPNGANGPTSTVPVRGGNAVPTPTTTGTPVAESGEGPESSRSRPPRSSTTGGGGTRPSRNQNQTTAGAEEGAGGPRGSNTGTAGPVRVTAISAGDNLASQAGGIITIAGLGIAFSLFM